MGVRAERMKGKEGEGRTHGRVCLGDTSSHTTEQTSSSGRNTHTDDGVLNLARREEEDGTLGRCFDPGLVAGREMVIKRAGERAANGTRWKARMSAPLSSHKRTREGESKRERAGRTQGIRPW